MNDLIQIDSIETPDGLINVQGYRVYLIDGIALSIRANGGGLGHGGVILISKEIMNVPIKIEQATQQG